MSDAVIVLLATTMIVGVVTGHHWLERYLAWRAWDKQRRADRRLHIAFATMRVRFREMHLTLALELLPAVRKTTRATQAFVRAIREEAA